MIDLILSIVSFILLLAGLISMVTPIPGGTLLIAFSLATLICTSPLAQRCLRAFRSRFGWLNRAIYWVENKVGTRIQFISSALKQTRPENEPSS